MANSNFIQDAIFKAVDVILEKRLKSLEVNYCILGIIDSEKLKDEKQQYYYYVNYQDMRIKAYLIGSSESSDFQIGELVYTLIINGDLSKRRLILCRA